MNIVSEFFLTLRPVFTVNCLRIVWYVYLAVTVIEMLMFIPGTMEVYSHPSTWVYFLPHILRTLAFLIFVRLFLEVAVAVLKPRDGGNEP